MEPGLGLGLEPGPGLGQGLVRTRVRVRVRATARFNFGHSLRTKDIRCRPWITLPVVTSKLVRIKG